MSDPKNKKGGEELAERLKDIGADVNARQRKSNFTKYAAAGLLATTVLGGGYVFLKSIDTGGNDRVTNESSVGEFPEDVAGFGDIELPEPQYQIDTSASDAALSDMERRLKELEEEQRTSAQKSAREHEAALEDLRKALEKDLDDLREAADKQKEAAKKREKELLDEIDDITDSADRRLKNKDKRIKLLEDQLENGSGQYVDPGQTDEDRRRAEFEAKRQARISSGMVAISNGGAEGAESEGRELSARESFVKRDVQPVAVSSASIIARPDITITQGTIIQAALETAIDSSLPGPLRAIVSEDVHSFDGSNVVIPRGYKLYGEYQSDLSISERRVLVVWTRIVLPEGKTVDIASFGADRLGRSGTGGHVDTHFANRFGSAALISIIGSAPAIAAASVSDDTTSDTLENVANDLSTATGDSINKYLKIAHTLYVHQGSAITVILDRDIEVQ